MAELNKLTDVLRALRRAIAAKDEQIGLLGYGLAAAEGAVRRCGSHIIV